MEKMRKYLGIVSILILVTTFFLFYIARDHLLGQSYILLLIVGYLAAVTACWYSVSGVWRKVSATLLVVLPLGFIALVLSLSYAWSR